MIQACFEAITNRYFKTRDDGTRIFYPQGALGRLGYIVSSPELEERLRSSTKRFVVGCGLGGALLGGCLGELASSLQSIRLVFFFTMLSVIFCLLGWLGAKGFFWQFTRQMTAVHEANSFKKSWLEVVQTLHPWLAGLMATVCLLVVVASLVIYRSSGESKWLLLAAMFTVVSVPWMLATWILVRTSLAGRSD